VDADEVIRLEMPLARIENDELHAHAIGFDRFGNVMLDVEHAELAGSGLRLGRPVDVAGQRAVFATTFADVARGELLLYEDAYRTLALAVNRGSARERLSLELDAEIRLRPA
jgi:S-adenosylmethionine hydrolase